MKSSFYNHEEDNGDNYILYNCASDAIVFLNNELKKVWKNSQPHLERIQDIHPEFYSYLTEKGFVVADNVDEKEALLSKIKEKDSKRDFYSIIVNPTLDCNMCCWYCYEKHNRKAYMSKEVMDSVLLLSREKIADAQLKGFNISFFGGEPLLAFDTCVLPLLKELDSMCLREKKTLTVSFTSNGYLLNEGMIKELSALHLASPIQWQITLDGGPSVHNKTKHTADSQGTYDTTVENIHRLLAAHMNVLVRMNYRSKSILSFLDVIDSFREAAAKYGGSLQFGFQQVWQDIQQCGMQKDDVETLLQVRGAFEHAGLFVLNNTERMIRCYADRENSIIINYDGNIFKCTAQDFKEENSEGVLHKDGTISFNPKYYRRMKARFANNTCLSCKIYPLCYGGCTQRLLSNTATCCKGYDEEKKIERIHERILFLAGRINNNQS